jgi:hypothetical protein
MGIPNGYVSGQVIMAVPVKGNMKVDRFTTSGTFTPPAGVTYAIAHIRGAGAGLGSNVAGTGGTSSVAFAGGTVSAVGGAAMSNTGGTTVFGVTPPANSGLSAQGSSLIAGGFSPLNTGNAGAEIVAGGDVTAGVGITVTVGAGGTAGTAGFAGADGYVWIEYLV